MKIRTISYNNHKQAFEVHLRGRVLDFPYVKAIPQPTPQDPIMGVAVDPELGREGFSYVLASGVSGTIHLDHVLAYHQDPGYLRDLLLYQLTLAAQERVRASGLAKRAICRRLGTSATQLYRLLDQTNYRKSVDQLLHLLHVLDSDVHFVVTDRPRRTAHAA